MIYLEHFLLASERSEEAFKTKFVRTCFDTYYPFNFFPLRKELEQLDFSDITILSGSNGSGKSTVLNVIAEKLGLKRDCPFNKTYFFDPYLEYCEYNISKSLSNDLKYTYENLSRIITSDDVFKHIIDVRAKNANLDFKRNIIFDEFRKDLAKMPERVNFDDPESLNEYEVYSQKRHSKSASRYVRNYVGVDERTYSNGENGFKYFTDAIQPGGLYLLDEPENSLSTEMQLELVKFIQGMARFYNCQFIISTHSPFILSIKFAKIYDMDSLPVRCRKWTDLPNVRLFYDFFMSHADDFETP